MTKLKKYSTLSDWETAKSNLVYPSVGLIEVDGSVKYMTPPPIHSLPIKAVFYDSATGNFVKMYPDEITEVIPNYTPIGVEVIPAEHDVYGTGQAGVMSLTDMNCSTPDTGSTERKEIRFGDYDTDTSLPNYDGTILLDGTTAMYAYIPSDKFTNATSLDGVSKYYTTSNNAPSPYNSDGSRNEAYYATASTANVLSDFDGVGNTKVFTDLATSQSDWKTATTITDSYDEGYYPAACCCWRFHTAGTNQGQWYLPAMGEMGYVINRLKMINSTISKIWNIYNSVVAVATIYTSKYSDVEYWSSSENSGGDAYFVNSNKGLVESHSNYDKHFVRAFLRM